MSVYILAVALLCCVYGCYGLQCFQCGQYNDGVGSITPCINATAMKLKDCPNIEQTYCIKYVSEGSTVRDCVQKCAEKETWGTRTYCCREDGCNTASLTWATLPTWLLLCGVLATQLSALLNRLPH